MVAKAVAAKALVAAKVVEVVAALAADVADHLANSLLPTLQFAKNLIGN